MIKKPPAFLTRLLARFFLVFRIFHSRFSECAWVVRVECVNGVRGHM
jgi:hypothetical protein